MLVHVRKAYPGSDSFGHEWPTAGSVVEMDDQEARQLLAIKDAGFTLVEDEPPADPPVEDDPAKTKVTEPGPDAELTEPDPDAAQGDGDPDPAAETKAKTTTGRGRGRAGSKATE